MMIAAGYAAVFVYVFFLIFVLGSWVQKFSNQESSRKVVHTMLFMVWVFIDIFFKNTYHQIIIPAAFLVLNALSFKLNIYKSVERADNNHMGTVFFAAAILTVMSLAYFFPALYLPSGAAAFCLTFGDGFAALVGYNVKSKKLRESKSLAGFLACFAASAASLIAFKFFYWPELTVAGVLTLAAVTAVTELTGGGLDNFTVTYGVFAASWLITAFPGTDALQGILWALSVFAVVFFSGAISYAGSLLAMIIVFVFRFCGGNPGLAYLLASYFTIFGVGIIRKKLVKPAKKEHSGRGFYQILINGGLATACLIAYRITGEGWWLPLSVASVGGCFIDSVSSDVGCLSARMPYDPIRMRPVPRGISGGMTVLGTSAAMAFSLLIGLFAWAAMDMQLKVAAVITAFVFAQTLLDTILGSLIQVKYRCGKCGEITEKPEHCGLPTVYDSGLRFVDNNMVNLVSSLAITLAAGFVLRAMV